MFRRVFPVLFLLAIVAAVMLACGESDANTGSAAAAGPAPTSVPTRHFKVGETVKVGESWQILVLKASTNDGTQFDTPQKPGDTFLLLDVRMKNLTSSEQNVSSLIMFSVQDSTGQKITQTITTFAPAAPDGKVEPGAQVRGTLAYEVAKSEKHFTLAFQADITSTGQTIWDVRL